MADPDSRRRLYSFLRYAAATSTQTGSTYVATVRNRHAPRHWEDGREEGTRSWAREQRTRMDGLETLIEEWRGRVDPKQQRHVQTQYIGKSCLYDTLSL